MSESSEPARISVDIPGFSGPLELLVHLIAKHEMDILSVSISSITDAYLKSIREMEEKDLEQAGEFLVLGAALVRYKARALLPREEVAEEDDEIDDHILEMRRQEYERFRQLAEELKAREELCTALFPRVGPSPEGPRQVVEYEEVSVYDLFKTFQKIIDELGTLRHTVVESESYSVDEKMLEIQALLAHNRRIVLTEYLRTLQSKLEMIVVFMALLEMIRLREVHARQEIIHGEIVLERGEGFQRLTDDEDSEDEDASEEEKTDSDNPDNTADPVSS